MAHVPYVPPERVTLPGGLRLAFTQTGQGEPVLCLSGDSDSSYAFAQGTPFLPEGVRLLALTHRGHGDSDRPEEGYRIQDLASDARAFLDALEVPDACVVGHSLGSFVAQELALAHPERVSRLVLLDSAPSPLSPATRELETAARTLEDPVDPAFVREFQRSCLYRPIPDEVFETVVAESLKMPARVWKATIAGMLAYDASARLSALRMPVLVMYGEHDAVFERAAQDALLRCIPGARLTLYPGCGHTPHWELPEAFTRELVAFLRGERGS